MRATKLTTLGFSVVFLAFAHCSSDADDKAGVTISDAGQSDGSMTTPAMDAAGDAAVDLCANHTLPVGAEDGGYRQMKAGGLAVAPVAAGGPIVDGVYVLGAVNTYSDGTGISSSDPASQTIEFSGSTFKVAMRNRTDPASRSAGTFTVDAAAKTITFNTTCTVTSGGGSTLNNTPLSYTATATTFTTMVDNMGSGSNHIITHAVRTKQ